MQDAHFGIMALAPGCDRYDAGRCATARRRRESWSAGLGALVLERRSRREKANRKVPTPWLGQTNYESLLGSGLLAGWPIKHPRDLEGKKLGASVSSGEYPFLPLYAQKAGFDLAKVQIVQIDGKVRERSLMEKQVDAVSAFATSTIPSLSPLGTEVRF